VKIDLPGDASKEENDKKRRRHPPSRRKTMLEGVTVVETYKISDQAFTSIYLHNIPPTTHT